MVAVVIYSTRQQKEYRGRLSFSTQIEHLQAAEDSAEHRDL